MAEQQGPGAYYGANVQGSARAARGAGDDRPSGSPKQMESTMNTPKARQRPVEGAVTGPDAPPIHMDEFYSRSDLDGLGNRNS